MAKKNTNVPDLKSKRVQLTAIGNALQLSQRSSLGPRASFSLITGVAGGIVSFATASTLKAPGLVSLMVALIVGIVVAVLTYRKSKLPSSYGERLDSLLAEYDPVYQDAFVTLQKQVRASGMYRHHEVAEWITEELRAIDYATSPLKDESQFLKREL